MNPLRTTAHHAYLTGENQRAIELQIAEVNRKIRGGKRAVTERKLLGLYLYSAGEHAGAIEVLKSVRPQAPDDSEIPENIGVMLRQQGKPEEAVKFLLKAHAMAPDRPNICDGLAHCYGTLGEAERCRKFGRLSLELKDRAASESNCRWPIPDGDPPAFSFRETSANVIAFSLWGKNPRYLRGAIRNAALAPDLYPGWTCRFYCDDTVPESTREQLKKLGAIVMMMPRPDAFFEGLFWRFRVIGDPEVRRFLIRDCDSVINVKERVAVDAWLASGKWFHVMRDFHSHTEVILAGMWGGTNGALSPLATIEARFDPSTAPTRTRDQQFLRDCVWPTVRQSVLQHDSVYTGCIGSEPFPAFGALGPNRHVGQNEAAVNSPAKPQRKNTTAASA